MTYCQADLELAERHVAQATRHVVEQEERIMRLRSLGHPTKQADDLLLQFEFTLRQHEQHRDAIFHDLANRPDNSGPK